MDAGNSGIVAPSYVISALGCLQDGVLICTWCVIIMSETCDRPVVRLDLWTRRGAACFDFVGVGGDVM